uniref:non-specific serine/threonine protein kinase n=1 Tax=Fagus sylvatica TaxID=28930 RepID=A0A2N9FDG0_FAGSY
MWNNISGSIPREIGSITPLKLLLLNGNKLTGPLPEELGYLPNLNRLQIDENQISGPLPTSFANLTSIMHFSHMNNNSISGQIPPELSKLPNLLHLLIDNNNLSGNLPPEFSELPNLQILQLDNNNFNGTTIPASYSKMSKLLKLSLRNCSLQGPIPDLSQISNLYYLDLSSNQLNGTLPEYVLSQNITTMELQNNQLSDITGTAYLPPNVTVWLQGNPYCLNSNLAPFCGSESEDKNNSQSSTNTTSVCLAQGCPPPYEYSPTSPVACFCALPLFVGYRLKSPGFSDFQGPRLRMDLKFFPVYDDVNNIHVFNESEAQQIFSIFTSWDIQNSDLFGPYELILDFYKDEGANSPSSGLSKGALAGLVLGTIVGAVTLSAVVTLLIMRMHVRKYHALSRRRHCEFLMFMKLVFSQADTCPITNASAWLVQYLSSISANAVGQASTKYFTYGEMAVATNNFNISTQVGQGGYGKVYKGSLADGTVVAIKRAQEGSLQGEKEFLTEIELLSRLHHRNLVSLIGYCDEESEQMLVYEFMSNGTLRDHLSAKCKEPMSFAMRLRISLGSAKGILYLHTEADPPIFHRDIKASNILLDSKYTAKVADFGLSRLAPVPDIEGTVPDHVSTVVKGTPGYLDPEYFLTRKLTDKSDVYSLGIVFLELLTGKQPISHGKNIVREVKVGVQSGMIFSVVDERMGPYPSECVVKYLTLALKCCEVDTDARPSMAEVVRELESIWLMMPDSDIKSAAPMVIDFEKDLTPSSSSSMMKNPYASSDVSGIELVSGVIPSMTPR